MIFAASYQAPVVFVCQNNHWAISEPVAVQSQYPIAGRAPGFGIPSVRVDGNDILACMAAMRWALEHARSARALHTSRRSLIAWVRTRRRTIQRGTRDEAELESWRRRDPIARLEAHLRATGALTDEHQAETQAAADVVAKEMRAACLGMVTRPPLAVFDGVYAEPHTGLERQRGEYAAYLASFESEASA